MRIAVIGTGYVGLVSGVCFSDIGHEVICVDKDAGKITRLVNGEVPIYEPGLDEILARNVAAKRLAFTTDLGDAVKGAEAVFIAVGTPMGHDGHANLSYVYAAAQEIAEAATGFTVVVTKSTVPVGTNREVLRILSKARPELGLAVASNPEFLREGAAIEDFMQPDRVVVGVEQPRARETLAAIYDPLADALGGINLVWTGLESAEMIKYAANAFLATKITFINEVAALCEKAGADVEAVARGMGMDARIGARFLQAGPGYGGSCFPKDTSAFAQTGRDFGAPQRVVETVMRTNDAIRGRMVTKISALLDHRLAGRTITVLGVTFKANTDDMRDSPSLDIIPALQKNGASVRVVDPQGRHMGEKMLPGVEWIEDAYEAATGADLLVVLTEWPQFRELEIERLADAMPVPRMADLRNLFDGEELRAAGFLAYDSVGRPGFDDTAVLQSVRIAAE